MLLIFLHRGVLLVEVEAPMIEELSLNYSCQLELLIKIKFLKTTNMFLKNYGNPYNKIGLDDKGKVAIEWGVYGVPETFIINNRWQDNLIGTLGHYLYDVYEN